MSGPFSTSLASSLRHAGNDPAGVTLANIAPLLNQASKAPMAATGRLRPRHDGRAGTAFCMFSWLIGTTIIGTDAVRMRHEQRIRCRDRRRRACRPDGGLDEWAG